MDFEDLRSYLANEIFQDLHQCVTLYLGGWVAAVVSSWVTPSIPSKLDNKPLVGV